MLNEKAKRLKTSVIKDLNYEEVFYLYKKLTECESPIKLEAHSLLPIVGCKRYTEDNKIRLLIALKEIGVVYDAEPHDRHSVMTLSIPYMSYLIQ